MQNESRFRMIERANPERYKYFLQKAQEQAEKRYAVYKQLAGITVPVIERKDEEVAPPNPAAKEVK